jgi:hypothetical protein
MRRGNRGSSGARAAAARVALTVLTAPAGARVLPRLVEPGPKSLSPTGAPRRAGSDASSGVGDGSAPLPIHRVRG